LTIFQSSPRATDPATSGSLPAVRRRRRALRVLLALVAVVLVGNVLLVEAYTNAGFGSDGLVGPAPIDGDVPSAVRHAGPVLDVSREPVRSYRMPPGRSR
jgi:hypothetical protein